MTHFDVTKQPPSPSPTLSAWFLELAALAGRLQPVYSELQTSSATVSIYTIKRRTATRRKPGPNTSDNPLQHKRLCGKNVYSTYRTSSEQFHKFPSVCVCMRSGTIRLRIDIKHATVMEKLSQMALAQAHEWSVFRHHSFQLLPGTI